MRFSKTLTALLLLGLTTSACCYSSHMSNSLGRKTLSSAKGFPGRSLLEVDISAAQSAASSTFVITSEPADLQGGECLVTRYPGNNGTPVQGPLEIKVGVGSSQNITFNATDGQGAYLKLDLTGDAAVLDVDQNDAGLNSIAFTPTAAGQTTQFVAARMITTSPPMFACNITIVFTAINEIDISAAESAANQYFDIYSSQPDGRDASQAGQECFIKGYPGNTDANVPAVQGPMQINVTVGNLQYIGFKSVDSALYYQEIVANSSVDNAISVNQNDTYGLIGVTYKPTTANIGRWTIFTVGHYLNATTPVLACTVHVNFNAVPAGVPYPTPTPVNPTPTPTTKPGPYNPTPQPTNTPVPPSPTPTPTQTPTPPSPPSPIIGTCVGPKTCACQGDYCFYQEGDSITSICTPPEAAGQCSLAQVSPNQLGINTPGLPSTVDVCKCEHAVPTPPTPSPPAPAPVIGTCVGPTTCSCENGFCFNNLGNTLTSICSPPEGAVCSDTDVSPAEIGPQFVNMAGPVNVCKCSSVPTPPTPSPPTPAPPIGTCVGPQTCSCENGYCFSNLGSSLTSICTPPGGQQCSLETVNPAQIGSQFSNGYGSSVSVCSCGPHTSTNPPPTPSPTTPATPPATPNPTYPAQPPATPNPTYPAQPPATPTPTTPATPTPTTPATPPVTSSQSTSSANTQSGSNPPTSG